MAVYKVLQDIEAEDKLIGPLTLRQFIYAAIAFVSAFIAFKLATISIFLIAPFLPVIVLFGVLAAPISKDQSTEVWLLARVRFFLKPHLRIWNQSGAVNLVTITAPKKTQRNLTKNLSQSEVRNRLKALANTIDSRGWAIKDVNVNLYNSGMIGLANDQSDRLVDPAVLPHDVPSYDITAADDMLDATNNPTAQHLQQMISESDKKYHQQVIDKMNSGMVEEEPKQPGPDYWFMNDATGTTKIPEGYERFGSDTVVAPGEELPKSRKLTEDEKALLEQIRRNENLAKEETAHMRGVRPIGDGVSTRSSKLSSYGDDSSALQDDVTSKSITDPAIINTALANRDNWSVATQARQAEETKKKLPPPDEVTISLR